jgi:hypothetical protein
MSQMLSLRTVEELKNVLFLQKTITQRAKTELLSISRDDLLPEGTEFTEEQVSKFMGLEQRLLEKYAKYPTLTEFTINPKMYDTGKWGATFGVALLVGELVFEQVRNMQPQFGSVLRQMYILFLNELETSKHECIVEPLEDALKFKVTSEDGGEVSEEKERKYVRTLLLSLVEDFVTVSSGYGIIDIAGEDGGDEGYFITELGKRVLLHLLDASKFIEELVAAHTKFQSERPKLRIT